MAAWPGVPGFQPGLVYLGFRLAWCTWVFHCCLLANGRMKCWGCSVREFALHRLCHVSSVSADSKAMLSLWYRVPPQHPADDNTIGPAKQAGVRFEEFYPLLCLVWLQGHRLGPRCPTCSCPLMTHRWPMTTMHMVWEMGI